RPASQHAKAGRKENSTADARHHLCSYLHEFGAAGADLEKLRSRDTAQAPDKSVTVGAQAERLQRHAGDLPGEHAEYELNTHGNPRCHRRLLTFVQRIPSTLFASDRRCITP